MLFYPLKRLSKIRINDNSIGSRAYMKMKKMSIEDLKKIELDILIDVDKFCNKYGIKYYLCGGTLLGAVRHKGFIPWDDDMDIAMPRKEYERFLKLYNVADSRYSVSGIENNSKWHMTFARVEDRNTILYEKTLKKKYRKCCVFVDLFPIDGVPDNIQEEKSFAFRQKIFASIANASSFCFFPSRHYSDSKDTNVKLKNLLRTLLKYIAIAVFSTVNTQSVIKRVNSNSKKYIFGKTRDVGLTVFVWNWKFEKASFNAFKERQKFEFEGNFFWGPKGYDEYLTKTYGDYMTPPPVENQVSHHSFEAYLKDDKE